LKERKLITVEPDNQKKTALYTFQMVHYYGDENRLPSEGEKGCWQQKKGFLHKKSIGPSRNLAREKVPDGPERRPLKTGTLVGFDGAGGKHEEKRD